MLWGSSAAATPETVPHAVGMEAPLRVVAPDIMARLRGPECADWKLDATPLQALQNILHAQGLALQIKGCPKAPAPVSRRVLAVSIVVLEGAKAQEVVRGALGDGEDLALGTHYPAAVWHNPAIAASSEAWDDHGVSPDVRHNRRWLRAVMASQGYMPINGPWWAFVPTHSTQSGKR